MVKFLFWNINRKPIEQIIANLAMEHEIDVLMLAECEISVGSMLKALNRKTVEYDFTDSFCESIGVYTRFSRQFIQPILETGHWTIRRLILPQRLEILLAVTHLPSKLYWSDKSQTYETNELARNLKEVEEQVGHSRTVLVGDLNMNPFEDGIFSAGGLNAVMTKAIARRETRTVQGRQYRFFYNPMWGHFGDQTAGPPGTYYQDRAEHANLFWHIFDQVLLRPGLMDLFRDDELAILTAEGDRPFLSAKGLPNAKMASDHLPLLFSLNL